MAQAASCLSRRASVAGHGAVLDAQLHGAQLAATLGQRHLNHLGVQHG